MAFDPDKYLAGDSAPKKSGFDPDAYLAKSPSQEMYSADSDPTRRVLSALGNGAMAGINAVGRTVDRFTGAPMRAAIGAAQNADTPTDIPIAAIKAGWNQFGADPDKAPTGEDIVKRAGVPSGVASKVAGFGMDMAANPLNFVGGLTSKLGDVAEAAAPIARGAIAKGSELLTGAPSEAYERLMMRPTQVMNAENEGNALRVAKSARDELLGRDSSEDAAIRSARDAFRDKFGQTDVNTESLISKNKDFLDRNRPNSDGVGALSPDELRTLSRMEKKNLMTRSVGDSPDPSATFSEPLLSKKNKLIQPEVNYSDVDFQSAPKYRADGDFTPIEIQKNPDASAFPWLRLPENKIVASGKTPVRGGEYFDEIKTIPGKERTLLPEVVSPTFEGWQNTYANKSADDLHRFADYLGNQIKTFEQSKMPGSGDTRYQAYLRSLYGQVKDKLHTLDPEGLGAADAKFSDYATKANRLGRLENEDQMEGFINNFYGKNKTLMRESAQDLIPNSVEDIADIGASRAFTKQGPAGSEMGGRRIIGSGMGAVLGAHGAMTHNPAEMAAGLFAHMATSPEVHKQILGRSAQAIDAIKSAPWFKAMQGNPALLDAISSPELKKILGNMLQEQRNIPVPQFAESQSDREPAQDQQTYTHPDDAKQKFLEGN